MRRSVIWRIPTDLRRLFGLAQNNRTRYFPSPHTSLNDSHHRIRRISRLARRPVAARRLESVSDRRLHPGLEARARPTRVRNSPAPGPASLHVSCVIRYSVSRLRYDDKFCSFRARKSATGFPCQRWRSRAGPGVCRSDSLVLVERRTWPALGNCRSFAKSAHRAQRRGGNLRFELGAAVVCRLTGDVSAGTH